MDRKISLSEMWLVSQIFSSVSRGANGPFVFLQRRYTTTNFPQKVAFWKGNGTPYFRDIQVGEIF